MPAQTRKQTFASASKEIYTNVCWAQTMDLHNDAICKNRRGERKFVYDSMMI